MCTSCDVSYHGGPPLVPFLYVNVFLPQERPKWAQYSKWSLTSMQKGVLVVLFAQSEYWVGPIKITYCEETMKGNLQAPKC